MSTNKGGMMSVAWQYPKLFGRYLLTPQELQNLQDAIHDMAFDEGAIKYRHLLHVASGSNGGLTAANNSLKRKVSVAPQRITPREATVMAQLRAVKKELAASRFDLPLQTMAKCVAQYPAITDREDFVTATEIGKAMNPQLRGWQVYKLFEAKGWVIRIKAGWQEGQYVRAGWQITEGGKRYGKTLEYRTPHDQHVTGIHWRKYETLSALGQGYLLA